MGASKTELFSNDQNQMATWMKALGHPARVAILEYLIATNACVCGSIADALPLSQPTVSQHLKELKLAGLIKGTITGNAVCYCINKPVFLDFFKRFGGLAKAMGSDTDSESTCR